MTKLTLIAKSFQHCFNQVFLLDC